MAERKDVENCLTGRVEGAMPENIFSRKVPILQNAWLSFLAKSVHIVILPGKVCVHEIQTRILTFSRPDIGVSPGGEPVQVSKHLNQIKC